MLLAYLVELDGNELSGSQKMNKLGRAPGSSPGALLRPERGVALFRICHTFAPSGCSQATKGLERPHCVRAMEPFHRIAATPYGQLSGNSPDRATAARKQRSAPIAPSKCRGQSVGLTSFFATWRSIRRRVQSVRVGDALVNPASPDMAQRSLPVIEQRGKPSTGAKTQFKQA